MGKSRDLSTIASGLKTIDGNSVLGTGDIDLKTVNSNSLVGTGDITIPAGPTGPTGPAGPSGSDASVTTANVASATAGISAGAVGAYSFLRINNANSPGATRAPGATFAGSASHYAFSPATDNNSYTPSGTWRVMGAMVEQVILGDTASSRATVCLRIS